MMDEQDIEKIKASAREEGARAAAARQVSCSLIYFLIKLLVGVGVGIWFGVEIGLKAEGITISVIVGGLLFTGLWWIFLLFI